MSKNCGVYNLQLMENAFANSMGGSAQGSQQCGDQNQYLMKTNSHTQFTPRSNELWSSRSKDRITWGTEHDKKL